MKEKKLFKSPLGVFFIITYSVALISAALHVSFYFSRTFADSFNMTVSAGIRTILAKVTEYLPFSLAEAVIICMPVTITVLIIACVHTVNGDDNARSARMIGALFSALCILYSGFALSFAPAYRGQTLSYKLGLAEQPVSADELYETGKYFLEEIKKDMGSINFTYTSGSRMPYSLGEMTEKLNEAYGKVSAQYSFVQSLDAKIKFIALSKPMTYTHISGIYTYYTGEANININFPDYTLPYTAAHEMSHQRGIAPENEANFMGYLVCRASDDPYIRYSGNVGMLEYISNALYSADREKYNELWSGVDLRLRYEESEYSRFFAKYSESKVSVVSGAVNDTYLKAQGQSAGSKSYGMVVDLAVAYVKSINENG